MVEQRGLPCASRYTVFIAQKNICVNVWLFTPALCYCTWNKHKTQKLWFLTATHRRINNPKPDFLADKHALTHQPKSTIFAHLLGLPCCLLPTISEQKHTLIWKVFCQRANTKHQVECEPIVSQFVAHTLVKDDCRVGKVARRRPVGNHVVEWRAAPSERKYVATTPQLSPFAYINYGTSDPRLQPNSPPPLPNRGSWEKQTGIENLKKSLT